MALPKKLKECLTKNKARYKVSTHKEAFTSQEVAAAQHVPGKELAKVVVVKGGDDFVMAVLPASYSLILEKLKKLLKVKSVRLAKEKEMESLFPDCEVGAMPPFGNLYNLTTYVDKSLSENESIVFEAGDHRHTLKMKYKDFDKLTQPRLEEFAKHL